MKIGRKGSHQRSSLSQDDGEDLASERSQPEMTWKDIVAVIIAMFQLVLPLVGALILVGAIVALLLH